MDYTLTIPVGADFEKTFEYRTKAGDVISLGAGASGHSQVRRYAGQPLLLEFTVTVDGPNGRVTLSASKNSIASAAGSTSEAEFDVLVTRGDTGKTFRFLSGAIVFDDSITEVVG